MTRATQVTDVITFHGEGPFWDEEAGRLLLVDMLAGAVVELGADLQPVRHEFGGVAAVIRRRTTGGFVLAVERGFQMLDDDLRPVGQVLPVFDDPAIRMNEGGCDPQGRFYAGTMAYDATEGAGTLFRLDANRSVSTTLSGVTISNGLQWSEGGGTAFYNDTPTDRVSRYACDAVAGTFSDRSTVIDLSDLPGHPDGMAIDVEGGLWVAMFGGSAVHRIDRQGRLSRTVEVDASNVTSCTFGGPDRSTLYITTSRDGLDDEASEPAAGAVFAFEAGVRGAPQHAYAG